MKKIAEGWHSEIFLTENNTVIKKFKKELRKNYEKEKEILLRLKDYDFVPKLIRYNDETLEIEMEYIDCKNFLEVLKEKEVIKNILLKILDICYILDKMKIEKEEMHRPYKHIFICNDRIVLIDWERAREKENPSNVTQFIQFLIKEKYLKLDEELKNLLILYKKSYSEKEYAKLKEFILKNIIV